MSANAIGRSRRRRDDIAALLRDTANAWVDDYASSMGAALAYYTLFSIGPLILLVISVAGLVFGPEAARGEVFAQLRGLLGDQVAGAVSALLRNVQVSRDGFWGTWIGAALLLLGATSVLGELQSALNRIWRAPRARTTGVRAMIRKRLLSLGLILALGFLLMVSLTLSAGLAAAARWWSPLIARWHFAAEAGNFIVSLLAFAMVFALIYKLLPRVHIAWRDVWVGALVTAALFNIGKALIGLYIGTSGVASAFGAASSIVVLLIWVYYCAQLFLAGAEFTWAYAHRFGSRRGQPPPA